MGIAVDVILIILGTVSAVLSVSFCVRNLGYLRDISLHILFYGIMSSIWCLSYGCIGITEDFALCGYIRMVGVFAVIGFLVNECIFVAKMARLSRPVSFIINGLMLVFSLVDLILYAHPGLDVFFRIGSWTTWHANPEYTFNRNLHSVYVAYSFLTLFIMALIWLKKSRLKRQKKFVYIMIAANYLLIFFSLPDTFFPLFGIPAVSTSGIGGALCTLVIWYGATQLNYFDIRMGNIARRLIDFIDIGVIVFDTKGDTIITNNYCKKHSFNTDAAGQGIDRYFDIKSLDVESMYKQALSEEVFSGRLKGKYDDNIYSVRLSALQDDYGAPFCFLCVFADVTEEMKMVKRLEEASSAKSTFLAQMSHEIRTPIHAIMGMNEMILRQSDNKDITEFAQNIDSAGNTLLALINSILDFSKIEDGRMEIVPVRYDTADFINDLINTVSTLAFEKDLNFKASIDRTLPSVLLGDALRLSQVIMNLLTNAVKYTEKGEVVLTMRYDGRMDERALIHVSVKDTGEGIRKEDLKRIFESFERVDEYRNRYIEGSGLGISIVSDILKLMNSSLNVESTYGMGSVFYFTIAQEIVDETPVGDYEKKSEETKEKSENKPLISAMDAKILVVDDNSMNLKVINKLLGLCDIKPDLVSSGKEAIECMKNKTYDIVFMDHMMPEMDGIVTLHRLKEEDLIPESTAMIMLSANAIAGSREKYLSEGFDDYLSKPIPLDLLIKMLLKHLDPALVSRKDQALPDPAGTKTASGSLPAIEGIDLEKAFENMPDKDQLLELFKTFCDMSSSDVKELSAAFEGGVKGNDSNLLTLYRVKVHSMKNSAAQIGAAELSLKALELETAAREKNFVYIIDGHDGFVKDYLEMSDRIKAALFGGEDKEDRVMDLNTLLKKVDLIEKALEEFDTQALNDLSIDLDRHEYPSDRIKGLVDALKEGIRDFDAKRIHETGGQLRAV